MRLLVDLMCGGLVSYLRMCGHDTAYAGDRDLEADANLVRAAEGEDRTVVTRDVALAGRAGDAILLESRDVEAQLAELAAAGVALALADEPDRCGRCNGPLERLEGAASTPEYAPDPAAVSVWRCRDCEQCFWKGSHWDQVRETLSSVRPSPAGDETARPDDVGECDPDA